MLSSCLSEIGVMMIYLRPRLERPRPRPRLGDLRDGLRVVGLVLEVELGRLALDWNEFGVNVGLEFGLESVSVPTLDCDWRPLTTSDGDMPLG